MKTTGLQIIRRALLFAVLVSPSLRSDHALAQGICPPGSIPGGAMVPGQENAGWTACLPMGSVEEDPQSYDEGEPSPPPFSAEEFSALIEWEKANGSCPITWCRSRVLDAELSSAISRPVLAG